MTFVYKIITTLYPIFEKHGFEIIDENENRILFESAKIGINIANNPLEKKCRGSARASSLVKEN